MSTDMRVRPGSYFPAGAASVLWAALLLLVAGLVIRIAWYPVVTTDYTYFVRPWTDTLGSHRGLSAFAYPFADYAPLYLYFLKILALLPVPVLAGAKTISLAFDALVAVGAYLVLRYFSRFSALPHVLLIAGVAVFSLPTVMMNSSLWGQSDSLYAAGVIFSFLFVLVDAPFLAALAFGLAISTKVQAVFFAPVLAGYFARTRAYWKYFLIPPAVFFILLIPAWAGGGDLAYWGSIYAHQAAEYPYLSVSAQSIFAFVEPLALSAETTQALFWAGLIAAALAATGIVLLATRLKLPDPPGLALLSLAAVLVLPYLLPRMHERYFYLADLFALLYAYLRPGRILVPIFVASASLLSYMPFLSQQVSFLSPFSIDLRLPAALLLIPIAIVALDLVRMYRAGRFGLIG